MVNSAYCSYGGLGFGSHHPHAGSQVLVIPVPGDLMPLGSLGTCMHIVHINSHSHMCTQTQTHKLTQAYTTHAHVCVHTHTHKHTNSHRHALTNSHRHTDRQTHKAITSW